MTNIESTVTIERPINEVFNFLADLNNHQQLMPENIYNWSSKFFYSVKVVQALTVLFSLKAPSPTFLIDITSTYTTVIP